MKSYLQLQPRIRRVRFTRRGPGRNGGKTETKNIRRKREKKDIERKDGGRIVETRWNSRVNQVFTKGRGDARREIAQQKGVMEGKGRGKKKLGRVLGK